jgi:hypothetical protein
MNSSCLPYGSIGITWVNCNSVQEDIDVQLTNDFSEREMHGEGDSVRVGGWVYFNFCLKKEKKKVTTIC